MELVLTRCGYATLLREAAKAHPREACGLLLERAGEIAVVPTANVHPEPERHFEIDPAALIAAHRAARDGGPALVGYWHSHPEGPPEPSATDRAMASGDGRIWVIVGRGEARAWIDLPQGFIALPLRVAAG